MCVIVYAYLCVVTCLHQRVLEILSAIADGKTPFDLNRMQSILTIQIRGFLNKAGAVCICVILSELMVGSVHPAVHRWKMTHIPL